MTKMCIAAANYIINAAIQYNKGKALKEKIFLSSKRLQKLLFFSDVLYMVENNGQSMFHDEFYAWPSGPVIPSVYREFMQYQDGDMKPHDDSQHTPITHEMENAISRVLEDTNNLDTIALIRKSRETGSPWNPVFDENDSEFNNIMRKQQYSNITQSMVPHMVNERIVLGINPNDFDEINAIDTSFIAFKKYYQRGIYRTDMQYFQYISKYDENDNVVENHGFDELRTRKNLRFIPIKIDEEFVSS